MLKDSRGSLALPLFQQLDDGFLLALGGIDFGEILPQGIGRKGRFVQLSFLSPPDIIASMDLLGSFPPWLNFFMRWT